MTHSHSFNLLEEAWLPCLWSDGRTALLSLRQALLQAHELQDLGGDSPLERVALHRLLLAVLHRVFGPEDFYAWDDLWRAGRFPAERLEAYCEQWRGRFDLFDPERPFYQEGDERMSSKSVINLIPDLASGNNPTFFDHHTEEEGVTLTPAQAARVVVAAHAFGLSGICHPQHGLYFTDGPCARGVLFLVAGDNLFQTLMLNTIQYPSEQDPVAHTDEDRPAWEMDDPYTPERETPLGYLDYLTWQNRRILLEPEAMGGETVVRSMTVSPGLRLDGEIRDPMKHHRKSRTGFRPLLFDEERALWRDSAALFTLHSGDEEFAPLTFRWLYELVNEGILKRERVYRCLALGMSSYQARIYFFRSEGLPFPLAYLEDRDLVKGLRDATDAAEQVSRQLWGAARTLAKFLVSPLADTEEGREPAGEDLSSLTDHWGVERRFWTALDRPFEALVVALPQERGAALERWYETLWRAAWDALEHAVQRAGDDGRALKAAVQARRQLGAGLRKIPVFKKEVVNKERSV